MFIIMKSLVFVFSAIVFVECFPLEDKSDFEGHDAAVEIQTNGGELETLVRNKRQFNPYPNSPFQFQRPAPSYNFVPPVIVQPAPNPWSGNVYGGESMVGGRLNYDRPRGGLSVMGAHHFGDPSYTRAGAEGRLNLIHDKDQTLTLNARHMSNIGPVPKMPENIVGLTYKRTFG